MKLLLDENLAPRLASTLVDLYPGSRHVSGCGLKQASDLAVWEFARTNDFVIVSKDADFEQRALVLGHPPKVIRVRAGNCSTRMIEDILRRFSVVIHTFYLDPVESVLVLP
jgi:predicted nuclease of predicted toxin-antitoxin system